MATGIVFEFSASHHAVVVLLGLGDLGSHPSLATRKDATFEVVLPTCHKCSSKLCLLFGPFGPTSLQCTAKGSCVRITALGQPPTSRV